MATRALRYSRTNWFLYRLIASGYINGRRIVSEDMVEEYIYSDGSIKASTYT